MARTWLTPTGAHLTEIGVARSWFLGEEQITEPPTAVVGTLTPDGIGSAFAVGRPRVISLQYVYPGGVGPRGLGFPLVVAQSARIRATLTLNVDSGFCGPRTVLNLRNGRCVAITEDTDTVTAPSISDAAIYPTDDSGVTWEPLFEAGSPESLWWGRACSPEPGVLVMGSFGPWIEGITFTNGLMRRSVDQGSTWTTVWPTAGGLGFSPTDADLNSWITMATEHIGEGVILAAGYWASRPTIFHSITYRNLLRSTDGGLTFTAQPLLLPSWDPSSVYTLYDVVVPTPGEAYLTLGAPMVWRTVNGGSTWTEVFPDPALVGTGAFYQHSLNSGWGHDGTVLLVGDRYDPFFDRWLPCVWRSVNGGVSYTRNEWPIPGYLGGDDSTAIAMVRALPSGVFVAALTTQVYWNGGSHFAYSLDGGETFTFIWPDTPFPLGRGTPIDMAVTDDGAVLVMIRRSGQPLDAEVWRIVVNTDEPVPEPPPEIEPPFAQRPIALNMRIVGAYIP